MSKRVRTRGNADKQEISLMTLLANEATSDSRKLLKKYNKPDAESFQDLEVKLAKLYYEVPDKIVFEKEMAEIHPHKNWLIKTLKPFEKEEEKVEKEIVKEVKSNATGCGCSECQKYSNACGCSHSSFDGLKDFKFAEPTTIGTIAIIGILALTFIVISKQK